MQASTAVRSQAIRRFFRARNSKRSQNALLSGQFIQRMMHFIANSVRIFKAIHNHAKSKYLFVRGHTKVCQKRKNHSGLFRILFDHIAPEVLCRGRILFNSKTGSVNVISRFGIDEISLWMQLCLFCAKLISRLLRNRSRQFLLQCRFGGFHNILRTFIHEDRSICQFRFFFRLVRLLIQIIHISHQSQPNALGKVLSYLLNQQPLCSLLRLQSI